jgi:hypothetical protein
MTSKIHTITVCLGVDSEQVFHTEFVGMSPYKTSHASLVTAIKLKGK